MIYQVMYLNGPGSGVAEKSQTVSNDNTVDIADLMEEAYGECQSDYADDFSATGVVCESNEPTKEEADMKIASMI